MKIKDLIKVLQSANPDDYIIFELGDNNEEYRKMCAKAELMTNDCLNLMRIGKVEIFEEEEEIQCRIILEEDSCGDEYLQQLVEDFDKEYSINENNK